MSYATGNWHPWIIIGNKCPCNNSRQARVLALAGARMDSKSSYFELADWRGRGVGAGGD